jgi:hypothetical protein
LLLAHPAAPTTAEEARVTEFLTTREVAEALGVQEWRVESAIRRREIERPPTIAGVRLWSPEAVELLRAVFAARAARNSAKAVRS